MKYTVPINTFDIKKTDPISKVEDRFMIGANYPVRVLGIAETNTQ